MKGAKVAVLLVAFIASAAVLMAASRVYLAYRYQPPPRLLVRQPVDDPVLSQAEGVKPWVDDTGIDTSIWKTFGSEALGFWVRYPPEWHVTDCLAAERRFSGVFFKEPPGSTCEEQNQRAWFERIEELAIQRSFSPRPDEHPRRWVYQALLSYQEHFFAINGLIVLWLEYEHEDRGPEGEEKSGHPIFHRTEIYFQTPQGDHYEISLLQHGLREQLAASSDSRQRQKLLKAVVGSLRVR